MEIKARVALSLPNTFYKVILKYDTFEKATFDSYLIASLVLNTNSLVDAYRYIDEITGKGSLNAHFKKLYDEISCFTKEQIQNIIDNSLFPVTIIDSKTHFKYYPMFDATRMNNKVFDGNMRDKEELLKSMIIPQGEDVKFLSLDFSEEQGIIKSDTYNAIFSDEMIKVELDNGQYYPISKDDFNQVYKKDIVDLNGYLGEVGTKITEGNWFVLSKSIVDSFLKSTYSYKDSEGLHSILYGDCIKTIEIINVFGLFFYKETRINFSRKNASKCEDALLYLLNSKKINEFKTKSLLYLLDSVDDFVAQKVVQYILERKESKDIANYGLRIIKNGIERGWKKDVLKSIKSCVNSNEYAILYKIDEDLDFETEELMFIDDTELSLSDRERKKKYITEKQNIINEINSMIGEITTSNIRERIKSLTKSELKDRVKKFVDKRIGHSDKNYTEMNVELLVKEYEEIRRFYQNDFPAIMKVIETSNE